MSVASNLMQEMSDKGYDVHIPDLSDIRARQRTHDLHHAKEIIKHHEESWNPKGKDDIERAKEAVHKAFQSHREGNVRDIGKYGFPALRYAYSIRKNNPESTAAYHLVSHLRSYVQEEPED